jgi:hypothetical protein
MKKIKELLIYSWKNREVITGLIIVILFGIAVLALLEKLI